MPRIQTKKTKEKRFKRRYLSKSQAKRYLQLDNREFKRILIFKGIYPRVPKKLMNSQGKDKIYYATKEIKKVCDDPIIEKFRAYQTHMKKLSKAESTGDTEKTKQIDQEKPQYDLSTTILERYPTFNAALADLNDALSMVFLYGILPPAIYSDTTIEGHAYLTTSMHSECQDIAKRWRAIVQSKQALQKGFISIKGYFYEAVLDDYGRQSVTWVDPHNFASSKPSKAIEHRIMLNYLEFYLSFLKFVCFKIENDTARKEVVKSEEAITGENSEPPKVESAKDDDRTRAFRKLTFYVSREANPTQVCFVLRNLGCGIASEYTDSDVTHYVIDRPCIPFNEEKLSHVDYVQPQYIFDCLNKGTILPASGYGIGEHCPPHLSPFVVDDEAELVEGEQIDEVAELEAENASVSEVSLDEDVESMEEEDESAEDNIREAPYRSAVSAKKVEKQMNFSRSMKAEKKVSDHKSDEKFGLSQAVNVSKRVRGLYTAAKHSQNAALEKKRNLQLKRSQIQKGMLGVSSCGKFLQPKK